MGKGREKERERNINVWLPLTAGDMARNLGMRPDWESNQRLFGLQAGTQSTEQHQPGQEYLFLGTWWTWNKKMTMELLA